MDYNQEEPPESYSLNPELYNHMSEGEKAQYNLFIQTYGSYKALYWSGGIFVVIGIGLCLISLLLGIMLIVPGIICFMSIPSVQRRNFKAIRELEGVVLYRIKKRYPKTNINDWKEKNVDIKQQIVLNTEKSKKATFYCKVCGERLTKGSKFCPKCGKKR